MEAFFLVWMLLPFLWYLVKKKFPDSKYAKEKEVSRNIKEKTLFNQKDWNFGELSGVREFQVGDPKKLIHHKMTVKYGKLMVKQFEKEETEEDTSNKAQNSCGKQKIKKQKIEKRKVKNQTENLRETRGKEKLASAKKNRGFYLFLFVWMIVAFLLKNGFLLWMNEGLTYIQKSFGFLCREYVVNEVQKQMWMAVAFAWCVCGVVIGILFMKRRLQMFITLGLATVLFVWVMLQPFSFANEMHRLKQQAVETLEEVRFHPTNHLYQEGTFISDKEEKSDSKTGEKVALQVMMEHPQSMYLAGFIGGTYASVGWNGWDGDSLYAKRNVLSKLGKEQFARRQTGNLAKEMNEKEQQIAVSVKNAGTKFIYCPYGMTKCSADTMCNERMTGMYATGLHGENAYTFSVATEVVTKYPYLSSNVAKASNFYKEMEALFNTYVYEAYTAIPKEVENYLKKEIGGYEKGKEHISYEEANAIVSDYLQQHFSYSEECLEYDGSTDLALWLISVKKKGRDVHYATLAAVIYRYLGIPARYVEGYCVTKENAADKKPYETIFVKEQDAHAWVEVYYDGVGFLPMEFDPSWKNKMDRPEQSAEGKHDRIKLEPMKKTQQQQIKKVAPGKVTREKNNQKTKGRNGSLYCIFGFLLFGVIMSAVLGYWMIFKRNIPVIEKEYKKLLRKLKKRGADITLPYSLWLSDVMKKINGVTEFELQKALLLGEKSRYSKEKSEDKEIIFIRNTRKHIR